MIPKDGVRSSEPVDLRKHGSCNNTPIKAIGVFDFEINTDTPPRIYVFSFPNHIDTRTEFVIVPSDELFNRISSHNRNHLTGNQVLLVLWLMPDNHLFDATNIGVEGEWFFMGGGMAEGTEMDYTCFLNNWSVLISEI